MSARKFRGVMAVLTCTMMIAIATTTSGVAAASGGETCVDTAVEVAVGKDVAKMWGRLCRPQHSASGTVAVLVHGQTFNHFYWDIPYSPAKYSFRQMLNRAGYSTFVIDRLGVGHSDVPPSSSVNLGVEADAVHTVISRLRNGSIGAVPFRKVILGGHSLGAAITTLEASRYRDVDALLVTSLGHKLNYGGLSALAAASHPASEDPKFLGDNRFDSGYATTKPGTRAGVFYANLPIEPGLLASDEKNKDVNVVSESADPLITDPAISRSVHVPVMFAIGDHDPLFCGDGAENCSSAQSVSADESPFWTSAPSLLPYVAVNSGHGLNLTPNTRDYQAAVRQWADRVVGTG